MAESKENLIALALGSNVGDRTKALTAALTLLSEKILVSAVSNIYETPAAYVTDQDDFLNAALLGSTPLSPPDLLNFLKQTERAVGRITTFRNGPRVIDIDILFYEDKVLNAPELTIPHQRMAERDFVLRPLFDVAPDWQHPLLRLTVRAMLASLPPKPMKNLGAFP